MVPKTFLVPLNTRVGDLTGNLALHLEAARKAAKKGYQVVVFPMMGLTGWPLGDMVKWAGFVDDAWKALEAFAQQTAKLASVFVVGLPVRFRGKLYIAAVTVSKGKILAITPQAKPASSNFAGWGFGRKSVRMKNGTMFGPRFISTGFIQIGVVVGSDIEVSEIASKYNLPADMIVVQDARPYTSAPGSLRRANILYLSFGRATAYVNMYGANDGLVFDGDCLIAADGKWLVQTDLFNQGKFVGSNSKMPKRRARKPLEYVFERRVLGALDYLRKSGAKGYIIAESGGRDSIFATIVAYEAVCRLVQVFPLPRRKMEIRKRLFGISMPTKNNSTKTINIARAFCRQIGIPFVELPIGRLHRANMRAVAQAMGVKRLGKFSAGRGLVHGIPDENGQARERSLIVNTITNILGFLMVNTCDRSEDFLGFATKFGDGCGDVGFCEDLEKSDIEAMLWMYHKRSHGRLAAIRVCLEDTVPGPELRKGQTAQKDLKVPYPVSDYIRELFLINRLMPSEILLLVRKRWTDEQLKAMDGRYENHKTLVLWIAECVKRFTTNVHKLSVAPLCIAVDPASTFDRRYFDFPILTKGAFALDLARMLSK